tara:strand:+ start:1071 stop:1280 length:210 start_codon:yes stop_codon:yes gene_type:complete
LLIGWGGVAGPTSVGVDVLDDDDGVDVLDDDGDGCNIGFCGGVNGRMIYLLLFSFVYYHKNKLKILFFL